MGYNKYGDMALNKPTLQGKALSKLLDAAVEIQMNPETPDSEKAFLARQLVQVTLPHSSPGKVPIWKRQNGNLTLSIRSGWNHKKDEPIGYPYGTIPRLLLFWLTTETVKMGSRRLELGDSLAAFMRELGLDSGRGGPRSDATRLRNQMERLFRATISFDYAQNTGPAQGNRWLDMQIAPKGELWWDVRTPEQATIWGSWIELGEDFHNALISAPVAMAPAPVMTMGALKTHRKHHQEPTRFQAWFLRAWTPPAAVPGVSKPERRINGRFYEGMMYIILLFYR